MASGIDILPTLCDLAGVEPPEYVAGRSLLPAAADARHPGREIIVTQLYPDTNDLDRSGRLLRSDTHKYVCFDRGERAEMLFDLVADPGEKRNLAFQPEGERELQHHRRLLDQWTTAAGDPFQMPC